MTIDLTTNLIPLFAALTVVALISVATIAAVGGFSARPRRARRRGRVGGRATVRVLPREQPPEAGAA